MLTVRRTGKRPGADTGRVAPLCKDCGPWLAKSKTGLRVSVRDKRERGGEGPRACGALVLHTFSPTGVASSGALTDPCHGAHRQGGRPLWVPVVGKPSAMPPTHEFSRWEAAPGREPSQVRATSQATPAAGNQGSVAEQHPQRTLCLTWVRIHQASLPPPCCWPSFMSSHKRNTPSRVSLLPSHLPPARVWPGWLETTPQQASLSSSGSLTPPCVWQNTRKCNEGKHTGHIGPALLSEGFPGGPAGFPGPSHQKGLRNCWDRQSEQAACLPRY